MLQISKLGNDMSFEDQGINSLELEKMEEMTEEEFDRSCMEYTELGVDQTRPAENFETMIPEVKADEPGPEPSSATEPMVELGKIGDKLHVFQDTGQPTAPVLKDITTALRTVPGLYNSGGKLCLVRDGKHVEIRKSAQMQSIFGTVAEFERRTERSSKFMALPAEFARIILNSSDKIAAFPRLSFFTKYPVYDSTYTLVQPGYNEHDGIYYSGEAILPREGMEEFDKVLADFPWKSDADRANYIGLLLTLLLIRHFIGGHPGVIFNGNQPGVGKTLAVQLMAIILFDEYIKSTSFIRQVVEFEKNLGSLAKEHNILLIDNVRSDRGYADEINSPVLERCLTDPILSFRRIGTSERIERENDVLLCITVNSARMTKDLATRCVVVNLVLNVDPCTRTYSIPELLTYARAHRMEILGEFVGMVERWKQKGCPLADKKHRSGLKNWAPIIGGILEVNGVVGFLDNQDEGLHELTSLDEELWALGEDSWNQPKTASEWALVAQAKKLFPDRIMSPSSHGVCTKMGNLLNNMAGKELRMEIEGKPQVVLLKAHKRADRTEYVFRPIPEQGQGAQVMDVPDVRPDPDPTPVGEEEGAKTDPPEPFLT